MLSGPPSHSPRRYGLVGRLLPQLLSAQERLAYGLSSRRLKLALALFCGDILAAFLSVISVDWIATYSLLLTTSTMSRLSVFVWLAACLFILTLFRRDSLLVVPRLRLRILLIVAFVILSFIFDFSAGATSGGLLLDMMCAAVFLPLGFYIESAVRGILIKLELWGALALVVGPGKVARKVCDLLSQQPEFGLRPVGCLLLTDKNFKQQPISFSIPIVRTKSDIDCLEASPDMVVLTGPDQQLQLNAIYGRQAPPQVQFCHLISAAPSLTWAVSPSPRTHRTANHTCDPLRPIYLRGKRVFDLVVSIIFGVCVLPIIAVVCIAIKIMDPGPAFYVQKRVGRDGRIISVIKIRSMHIDSEKMLQEHLRENPAARVEWERYFKLRHDPRVLPVFGNFIRCYSIDELPQLWNIIRGDMSWVGPRPFPAYHLQTFDSEFQKKRASALPGLTGLWQISSRSDGDIDNQQAQDLFYVDNQSLWLDLYILLRTVPAALSAKGAR